MAPEGVIPGDQIDRGPSGRQRTPTWSWALLNTAAVGRRLSPVVPPKAVHSRFAWGGFIRLPFARMSPAPPGSDAMNVKAGFPELVLGALRSAFYRCMKFYERRERLGMT